MTVVILGLFPWLLDVPNEDLNGDAEIDGPEFFELENYSHLAMEPQKQMGLKRPDGPQRDRRHPLLECPSSGVYIYIYYIYKSMIHTHVCTYR